MTKLGISLRSHDRSETDHKLTDELLVLSPQSFLGLLDGVGTLDERVVSLVRGVRHSLLSRLLLNRLDGPRRLRTDSGCSTLLGTAFAGFGSGRGRLSEAGNQSRNARERGGIFGCRHGRDVEK